MLNRELVFLRERGFALEADASVLPFLVLQGFHPKLGARPMRDAVEKYVGDAVATDVLTEGKGSGCLTVDESARCLVVR
jgi:ATP-dependent Clp protease ATP-binding subunit ClpA